VSVSIGDLQAFNRILEFCDQEGSDFELYCDPDSRRFDVTVYVYRQGSPAQKLPFSGMSFSAIADQLPRDYYDLYRSMGPVEVRGPS
jgi:hypothetical protein